MSEASSGGTAKKRPAGSDSLPAKRQKRHASSFAELRAKIDGLLVDGVGERTPLLLQNATIPGAAIVNLPSCSNKFPKVDDEGNVLADLVIHKGCIEGVFATADSASLASTKESIDLDRKMVWPCFCEPHSHLLKSHVAPRCPSRIGSIDSAFASEFSDRPRWSVSDLSRRMEFSLQSAYVHGIRLLRTHLDGTEDDSEELRAACWEAFDSTCSKWAGKVDLQGVANLYLPLWNQTKQAERQLTAVLKRRAKVILGAYCGIIREKDSDEFAVHFKELFRLARIHNLPVDLHIDENNSPDAVGMLLASRELTEARRAGYEAPVLFGHCCALSLVPRDRQQSTLNFMSELSGVTVIANPLTNAWLQDRRGCSDFSGVAIPEEPPRTPQWRGLTLVQEFQARGTPVGLGGDNVRDFWHNYGDYDPMEVFRFGVLQGHLDKPHGSLSKWATATNRVPAGAFGKQFCSCALGKSAELGIGSGLSADIIIFNARRFSELLSRPQSDRIVVRSHGGNADQEIGLSLVEPELPDYSQLDDLVETHEES